MAILIAAAALACAQVQGPVIGYVSDGGTLRTMAGIPAAGSVGAPLIPSGVFSRIEVAPDQAQALAVTSGTGAVMLYTISSGISVPVQGVGSAPNRIVFSPSGTAAGLWFSGTRHFQLFSLSATPVVNDIDFSFTASDPSSLAVSDDGHWMVGAWPFSTYAVGPSGNAMVLPVSGAAEAVCFFHGRNDVAAITASQVVLITGIDGAVAPKIIWSKPDDPPPANPATAPLVQVAVGFAMSSDNRYLSVAGNLGAISTFDLAAGSSVGLDCACSPMGLFGTGGTLYRLTGLNNGDVRVFDASTNEVWFVPLGVPPLTSSISGGQ